MRPYSTRLHPIHQAFASAYFKAHEASAIFTHPDSAYVLAFSIIMLNTGELLLLLLYLLLVLLAFSITTFNTGALLLLLV